MIFPHFSAQLFLRIVCSKITLLIILVEVLNIDFFERSLIITCKKSEGFLFCFFANNKTYFYQYLCVQLTPSFLWKRIAKNISPVFLEKRMSQWLLGLLQLTVLIEVIIAGKTLIHTKRLRFLSNRNTSHAASAKGLKLKSGLTLSGPKSGNDWVSKNTQYSSYTWEIKCAGGAIDLQPPLLRQTSLEPQHQGYQVYE